MSDHPNAPFQPAIVDPRNSEMLKHTVTLSGHGCEMGLGGDGDDDDARQIVVHSVKALVNAGYLLFVDREGESAKLILAPDAWLGMRTETVTD